MRVMRMLAVLLVVTAAFAAQQVFLDLPVAHPVEVTIPPGAASPDIARMLKQRGVIRSAFAFRLLARLTGAGGSLQSGRYRFARPADLWEVLRRLESGDVMRRRLTVPEGLRTDEVLVLLADRTGISLQRWQSALQQVARGREAEGRLLPETYTFRLPLRPALVLSRMWRAADRLVAGLGPAWLPPEKLRIVASIIEKETARAPERALVAAVIRNRLRRRMALQMDPTVIYGLWRVDGRFSGNLRRPDLERDTPWNTYVHKGLPPTPICNPGAASLNAAAHPADTDSLYFVADGHGGHVFASTLAAHEKNVRRWLAIERRGGGE